MAPEQRLRSIRTPFVMPGLGPGIHEFACADAEIAEEESAILCRWMSLFLRKLVDARAKPWHDGGEVVCAGRGLRTAPGSGVLLRTSRVAAYPNAYGAWPWHPRVAEEKAYPHAAI